MPQSLRCPRCDAVVTVQDRDAGSRVKCPHCEHAFITPKIPATSNDDDDWLSLDDPMPGKPATPTHAGGKHSPKLAAEPPFGDGDEPIPSRTRGTGGGADTTDQDDLFGELKPITAPRGGGFPDATFAGFGSADADNLSDWDVPPAAAPTAAGSEQPTEYRVKCNVCGSVMYAHLSQQGSTISCHDCHSDIRVPPPPKVKPKAKIDIENATVFGFEEPPAERRREDPFRKSAADLLQSAERAEPEKTSDDYDTPSMLEWGVKVFGIFTDLNVMVRWIGLSLIGSVPAYFALSFDNRILTLGLMIGGVFMGVILIACGFAILQSVANDEKSVEEWPSLDPLEWLSQAWVALAAIGVSGIPVFLLAQLLFDNSLIIVGLTMFSIYTLFPFVLLSMLDMQTVTVPFSPEVARSVSSSQEAWGGFYFSAGVLFFGLFLLFVISASMAPPVAGVVVVMSTVAIVFTYFAMIGRLAFAIGQSVNEAPRENDIESERSQRRSDDTREG